MIPQDELLQLKSKLLPNGAEPVVDILSQYFQQIEPTQIILQNVPLLILGRHGMIAWIPDNGKLQKSSNPDDILKHLQTFLPSKQTLYLFVNLPELPVPEEVTQVLKEISERHRKRLILQEKIDAALDARDRQAFLKAVQELQWLNEQENVPSHGRLPDKF
ncbi:IDEAL domain-containing protein [Alicyclobacillus sp. TC]|uniref:IDEAL domain-containing protein n=1 Tax=Alicyclobacillus tolerans TaxID=90970 RepID=A0ABT9LVR9_9BACL|nr:MULTISPECIES: IDEAL domain-containing protein [Alicyclobacillus]MDP9728363.1 hypothetical protein [Alicyclobacillus tengchongensis]QRF23839.1 IDEAL domain-containing protein [Alicyclobacillus sp. TC]